MTEGEIYIAVKHAIETAEKYGLEVEFRYGGIKFVGNGFFSPNFRTAEAMHTWLDGLNKGAYCLGKLRCPIKEVLKGKKK